MRRPRLAAVFPLVLGDVVLVNLAVFTALALRFDGTVPAHYFRQYLVSWGPIAILTVASMHVNGLYRGILRYAGIRTLVSVVRAVTIVSLCIVLWSLVSHELVLPRSAIALTWLLEVVFLGALRMTPRLWREVAAGFFGALVQRAGAPRRKVLVVGAGDSGATLVRDMLGHPDRGYLPIGFVDDDPLKHGLDIAGVRVLGSCVDIPEIVQETGVRAVFIAAPSAPARLTRDILAHCRQVDVQCLTLPALRDYAEERAPLNQVRAVRIEDLVGRQQVEVDFSQVKALVAGKTVLVTGAGGSIGSEICRQLARLSPRVLLLLDHAENGLYFCYRDLLEDPEYAGIQLCTLVADIKDAPRLREIFARHRPEIVFHAAAHKHVPLLEANPSEAVLNNIVGTRNLLRVSLDYGIACFVQISTDKAVRPTSVMGATKRICEMLVAAACPEKGMCVSVRFGNVMDSEGSVIPLFRRQIARGGPVTVTHREARRYFMTISEAVRLVLQAAALGHGRGEIFLLDMGEPVRIMDLAEQMVRLSGLVPGRDIEIREIGLRSGEKLVEQLVSESVPSRATEHDRIRAYQGERMDAVELDGMIDRLVTRAEAFDSEAVLGAIGDIVRDFQPGAGVAAIIGGAKMAGLGAGATSSVPVPVIIQPVPVSAGGPPKEGREPWRERLRARIDLKHAIDVTAGALVLPAAMLGMIVISLALAVELGPPILVRERLVGQNRRVGERRRSVPPTQINRRIDKRRARDVLGQTIALWRFRTTPLHGGRPAFATRNPRIAPIVRQSGLDRLPWIFGLLTGQLSLVGPAPMDLDEAGRLAAHSKGIASRFTTRPGIAGLAQLLASPDGSAESRLAYDAYYVDHASPLLDLRILASSFGQRIRGDRDQRIDVRNGAAPAAAPHAAPMRVAAGAGRLTTES